MRFVAAHRKMSRSEKLNFYLLVLKFSQVRVIEGQFVPREPILVRLIGSFEKSTVREIGDSRNRG